MELSPQTFFTLLLFFLQRKKQSNTKPLLLLIFLFWNSSRLIEVAKIVQRVPMDLSPSFPQLPVPPPPHDNILHNHSALSRPGNWPWYNFINSKSDLIWVSPVFTCNNCFVLFCFPGDSSVKCYHMDRFCNHQDIELFQSPKETPSC